MPPPLSAIPALVKETVSEVIEDDLLTHSAAIAYYTVFSLPSLLVILVALAGVWLGPEAVREAILGEADSLIGPAASQAVDDMIRSAGALSEAPLLKLVGVLVLLFGATGAFGALQGALNRAWDVEPAEGAGWKALVFKRVLSFGMVLVLAFFLLASAVLSAALTLLSEVVVREGLLGLPHLVWTAISALGSFVVITGLFAVLYKVLPDAQIAWRDVGVGAVVTAALFSLGKWGIGVYLGASDPGSAFGAAGSLAVILVWIYYSSLVVLVGAEFTQVYACRFGSKIRPDAPRGGTRPPPDH